MSESTFIEVQPSNRLLNSLLDLIYPLKCILCGDNLNGQEGPLCPHCKRNLPCTDLYSCRQYGIHFHYCLSPLHYQGALRKSFRRYKFQGQWQYSRVYSRWMIQCLGQRETHSHYDLVTWIPLNRMRLFRRGYDQTKLLAKPVARYLGQELASTLKKWKNIQAQSHLKGAGQRRQNVKGAFTLQNGVSVEGKRILLVDDLITTGATLEEAAGVLMDAGAVEVCCLTLACGGEKNGGKRA